jgi:hypothetical protein
LDTFTPHTIVDGSKIYRPRSPIFLLDLCVVFGIYSWTMDVQKGLVIIGTKPPIYFLASSHGKYSDVDFVIVHALGQRIK